MKHAPIPDLEQELRKRCLNPIRAKLIVRRFGAGHIRRCLEEHDREFDTLRKTERPDLPDKLFERITGGQDIDSLLYPV